MLSPAAAPTPISAPLLARCRAARNRRVHRDFERGLANLRELLGEAGAVLKNTPLVRAARAHPPRRGALGVHPVVLTGPAMKAWSQVCRFFAKV